MSHVFIKKVKTFINSINDALSMLHGLEQDLNITHFSPNELRVFYTIVMGNSKGKNKPNISDVVERSGMSRSTVYKTLKKLVDEKIIQLSQSDEDKRESIILLS